MMCVGTPAVPGVVYPKKVQLLAVAACHFGDRIAQGILDFDELLRHSDPLAWRKSRRCVGPCTKLKPVRLGQSTDSSRQVDMVGVPQPHGERFGTERPRTKLPEATRDGL